MAIFLDNNLQNPEMVLQNLAEGNSVKNYIRQKQKQVTTWFTEAPLVKGFVGLIYISSYPEHGAAFNIHRIQCPINDNIFLLRSYIY